MCLPLLTPKRLRLPSENLHDFSGAYLSFACVPFQPTFPTFSDAPTSGACVSSGINSRTATARRTCSPRASAGPWVRLGGGFSSCIVKFQQEVPKIEGFGCFFFEWFLMVFRVVFSGVYWPKLKKPGHQRRPAA